MSRARARLVAAALVACTACGGARALDVGSIPAGGEVASAERGPGTDERLPAATLLRPGDMVRLRIWREPDLSGEYLVDQDRTVVFPKIGPHRIGEESGAAFKRRIVAAFDEYLRNPSIDVAFLRRVGVQGAVRNPGLYNADLTITVADVLALAGGVAPDGDPNRVDVVRNGARQRLRVDRTMALAESPIRTGDQIYVHRESWLRRNAAVVAGVVSSLTGVLLILATR